MKRCPDCQQTKPRTAFAKNRAKPDGLQSKCRECKSAYDRTRYRRADTGLKAQITAWRTERRKALMRRAYAYLSTHPCVDCGESDPVVLQFDHVRGRKVASISEAIQYQWSDVRFDAEVEKCAIRCANCHTRRTAKNGNWFKLKMGHKH